MGNKGLDFKHKEVINIIDGRRLGFVQDVNANLETGIITSIVVPGSNKLFNVFSCENFLKPFSALCTNVIIISILVFGIVTPIENLNRGILLSVIVFANTIVSFKFVIIAKLLNVKNKKIMRFDWELLMPFVIVMNLLVVLSAIRYSY